MAPRGDFRLVSGGHQLEAHLARPPATAMVSNRPGLVLCHGFPVGFRTAPAAGSTLGQLADRVAADTGWTCLSFRFRAAGTSEGEFSLSGWQEDLRTAVSELRARDNPSVWVAGFSLGGTFALTAAAEDPEIQGVAALAAPADLSAWARDPDYLLDLARSAGLVKASSAVDLAAWAAEAAATNPLAAAALIPPRPLLIVHGTADEQVPLADARALFDASGGYGELHVIATGGHALRDDPRAMAVFLGWLHRQRV